ncbi:MAG: cyclic nucleotide-binding domain-containing protein [Gemmatimonadota bacterium]|nr:cyclic nucleotide-binding domain-containing protein [Gemmatimonadota bacterium]
MVPKIQATTTADSVAPAPPAAPDPAQTMILQMLEETSWANDLDQRNLSLLARYIRVMYADKDVRIFSEGEHEHFLTILADGKIDILKEDTHGDRHVVVTLNRGKTFGELSLMDGGPRSSTAVAKVYSTLLILDEDSFNDMEDQHPALAAKILRVLARLLSQRLRMTSGRLVDHLQ